MKSIISTILILIFLVGIAAASLSCETPSGTSVTLRGGLSTYELWRSTYNWGEIKAAMAGGMKLHSYMHEHELDWLVLTVAPTNAYWDASTRISLTLAGGGVVESVDLVCTDSPLERRVFHVAGGLNLSDAKLARVPSGGVLVMAGFPLGSLIEKHGEYWGELVALTTMEICE